MTAQQLAGWFDDACVNQVFSPHGQNVATMPCSLHQPKPQYFIAGNLDGPAKPNYSCLSGSKPVRSVACLLACLLACYRRGGRPACLAGGSGLGQTHSQQRGSRHAQPLACEQRKLPTPRLFLFLYQRTPFESLYSYYRNYISVIEHNPTASRTQQWKFL